MELSIIIPVYNGEKYIKECLNSIYNPLLDNIDWFEVIIVNDGSIDNTASMISKYKYENLKIFNNDNNGVSYSRNYGLSKSSGKYIMFVDADDKLKEDWSKTIKTKLENNKDFLYFRKDENLICSDKNDLIYEILGMKETNHYLSTPWAKIFKKDILNSNNIQFNRKIINGEDMLFNLKYIIECKDFEIINNCIYQYRLTPNSLTKSFNNKIFDSDKEFHFCLGKRLKWILMKKK